MQIQFTKGRGKPDTLACRRGDGSRTWSPLDDTAHDFGHYAIEVTMGWHDAFFGLLAQGWDIADFGSVDTGTGRRPAVPEEALQAEIMAGLLDMERRSGEPPPFSAFQAMLVSAGAGLNVPAPPLTSDGLAAVRQCQTDLLRRWESVPEGGALDLTF